MGLCSITYTLRDHDNGNSCLIEGVPSWMALRRPGKINSIDSSRWFWLPQSRPLRDPLTCTLLHSLIHSLAKCERDVTGKVVWRKLTDISSSNYVIEEMLLPQIQANPPPPPLSIQNTLSEEESLFTKNKFRQCFRKVYRRRKLKI